MKATEVVAKLQQKFPNQPEYIQAVSQVLGTIEDEYNKHPEFDKANLIERLCIPDRIVQFRVNWVDDKGNVDASKDKSFCTLKQDEYSNYLNYSEYTDRLSKDK